MMREILVDGEATVHPAPFQDWMYEPMQGFHENEVFDSMG